MFDEEEFERKQHPKKQSTRKDMASKQEVADNQMLFGENEDVSDMIKKSRKANKQKLDQNSNFDDGQKMSSKKKAAALEDDSLFGDEALATDISVERVKP